jgi:hypothetical protein
MKTRYRFLFFALLALLSLSLIGCGVPQDQYDELQSNLTQAQSELNTTRSQLSSVQKELDTTKAQVSSLQEEYADTESQLNSALSEIKSLQDTNAGQSDQIKEMQELALQLEGRLDTVLDTPMVQYYRFNFQLNSYVWDLPVSLRSYFTFKDKPRLTDIVAMARENDPSLDTMVRLIEDSALNNNLKKSDIVSLVGKLTQSFPRTNKDVKTPYDDYPRYPVETLVEEAGDSQDNAILAAALLYRLEYDVVFFLYQDLKHLAVGVYMPGTGGYGWEYKGKRYYYLETTGENWALGECPPQYNTTTPGIIPIVE